MRTIVYVVSVLLLVVSHLQHVQTYRCFQPRRHRLKTFLREEDPTSEGMLRDPIPSPDVTRAEYNFGREGDLRRIKIDPVRFVSFALLAALLALGGNFLGVTEALLSNGPESVTSSAQSLGLDQIYSVKGFKRYVSLDYGYEYVYPSTWLADQTITLSKVKMRETPSSLRYKLQNGPDSAFGPSASDGRINLSVVRSAVLPGFSLRGTLGDPKSAAEALLSKAIAPAGDRIFNPDLSQLNRNCNPR